ncbi:protein of unknown function [Halomonas shengliensis]|uniref:DUF349 domain-containing protein n=1 Tax=Halomonas shengliensis TaxID=419597 RepID=A0A1H0ET43_9GAMM|nr:DUF349 domain-containing protein [Halomonas shengliensis]SDN85541.1 protein of unknown function [Halomonas shengliensis]
MPGLFRRLFAPRWQHPDPGVRRQALERLDPARDDQRQALERLARDADPGVRTAALARLEDPERLIALLDDEETRSAELERRLTALICGREGGLELAARVAMVGRLSDTALLEAVALEGDNQQLRLAAIARLDDEAALVRQACDNGIAAVRHAAAARVESDAGLARLAREAKRDRQVMRQARERLNRRRADAAELAAARERREALLSDLERHATAPWEPLYAGRLRHLMREWQQLEDTPEASQERRYHDACLRCRKVIEDHEAQARASEAAQRHREDAREAGEGLVEALEEGLEALERGETVTAQDIDSLRAQKRLLAQRWQELADRHLVDEALRRRYDAALARFETLAGAWVRHSQRAGELERALADGDDDRAASLLTAIAWPEGLAPTALMRRARQALSQRGEPQKSDEAASAEGLEQELDELEHLLERGAFKPASRLHQRLRQHMEGLPAAARRPLEGRFKRLGARLAELRDWRGFVAGPKREQLVGAIEALAEDEAAVEGALDRRHRQLVKEWKSLGDAAANRDQSTRFRAASDRIHERLAPWRERLDADRQANLATRTALCEQLETLLDHPAQEADPDALREIRDRARDQWRRASPVPRDQAEAIGRRFGSIRHRLQALIDQRAREIAEAKRALIEEARTLASAEMPPARRAEQAKGLQRRWRELGRAPKGEEQALWREFRGLCDTIFASREAARDDHARQARERQDAMQSLIDRLDAWQPNRLADEAVLARAIDEAAALEPLPGGRRSEGMRRRWSGIVRARRERLERLAVAEQVEGWQAVRPLLEAHLAADAERLAGGEAREVSLPKELSLSDDMRRAHARRNAARLETADPEAVAEGLARLRVHLSLLAVGSVSQRDDQLRLAIQVERLNENLGREPSRAEEVRGVLCELLAVGPVSPGLWEREVVELDRMLERLAQLPPP